MTDPEIVQRLILALENAVENIEGGMLDNYGVFTNEAKEAEELILVLKAYAFRDS